LRGVGIDLAAGNLWAVPCLFKLGKIEKLYCLEYSKHRLTKIGPKVLQYYNVPMEKVVLVFGSFYNLHLEDNTLDFVFLSQALHHADRPDELLSEIYRVLVPDGIVVIIGEHKIKYFTIYIKNTIKFFISIFISEKLQEKIFGKTFKAKGLFPHSAQLLQPDSVLGDHYYTFGEYDDMFLRHGFQMKHLRNFNSQFQSFVLLKK